jgi:hypothetical protein
MEAALELIETYEELERTYAPFVDDGRAWKGDLGGLEAIVSGRDRALERGAALMARVRELWGPWEASGPDAQTRARVFGARNRLVELGLSASKADTTLLGKIRRRADDLRRSAADTTLRHKASVAYRKGRAGL